MAHVPIPSQPHPDVAIVKSVLKEMKPGEVQPKEKAAAALGLKPDDPVLARRAAVARRQLRHEGINVICVPGVGFQWMTDEQTLTRHQGRERKGLLRKARKAGEALANIDVNALPEEKRPEFFAERTINNIVFLATNSQSRQKMLAAAKVAQKAIPMAKALEVLTNGK